MKSRKKHEITVHGDERPWNTGAPPAPGWYEASVQRKANLFRWWDGEYWSWFALKSMSRDEAATRATQRFYPSPFDKVYWREIKV